jgi:hypothetical protein
MQPFNAARGAITANDHLHQTRKVRGFQFVVNDQQRPLSFQQNQNVV